jgi:hypothetical protein
VTKGFFVSSLTSRPVLAACAAVGLTLTLSGCSLFGGGSASGSGAAVSPNPSPTLPSGARVESTPGATAASAKATPSAAALPSLRPRPGAGKSPCNAATMVLHLSHASGAVHTYLAKPGTSTPVVIAMKDASTKALGAKAAAYAANELTAAVTAASGCATTPALSSVLRQSSSYLVKLSASLKGGGATATTVGGAATMLANVKSQSGLIGLVYPEVAPKPADLK